MAPTMVWVVETGQPRLEAIISQMAAASNAVRVVRHAYTLKA